MLTKLRIASLATLVGVSGLAVATPPADSAYVTDAQSSHVQDATSDSIGQVNMITCIMSSMRPDALVNQGPYIALVDQNKCDSSKQSSTANSGDSAGGAQAPNYMTAVVDSTRASNSDPMITKAWISIKQDTTPVTVFVHISATEAPSLANPYGAFRIDYCGRPDSAGSGACMMNGFMQGGSGTLSYYEIDSGGGSSQTALQLTSVGTTTGSGTIDMLQSNNNQTDHSAFDFAYNANLFLRNDSSSGSQVSQCFSRDATDPDTGLSVWRYGLYDSTSGARVARNSGFPIQYIHGGTTYQGYLGYYGLQLPADATATLVSGTSTVQKVDYGNNGATPATASYTVVTGGGRLVRYTKQLKTLKEIDQIHFNAFVGAVGASGLPTPNTQYDMYWDDGTAHFIATGVMQCNQNGCQTTTLSPIPVDPLFWTNSGGVQGWSQSIGGDLFIDLHGVSAVDSTLITVAYHVQDLVYPDDSNKPATLYCVNNCPTLAALQSYLTQGVGGSPYAAGTFNNFQPVQTLTSYSVDANALLNDGSAAVVDTNAGDYQSSPQYQNGVMSGRLFVNPADAQCNANPVQYCDWAVNSASVYYVWQTGPNNWDQFSAVKDSNTGVFVHFDAPLQVNFTVPAGAAYGSYANTSLVLQYGGFGDLWGIPGSCVSRVTNLAADCSDQNSRYVPQFVIPYDPTASPQKGVVTTSAGGVVTSYLVKWLDREIRFAVKSNGDCTTAGLATTTATLPTASSLMDPSDSSSSIYVGTKPTVSGAPRVIQGDVKY